MCKCFDWWIVVSNNGKALTIDRLYCGVLYFVEGWWEGAEFAAVSSREKIDHVMLLTERSTKAVLQELE
jgi:hypothetical protein